jgi:hypothetical protein
MGKIEESVLAPYLDRSAEAAADNETGVHEEQVLLLHDAGRKYLAVRAGDDTSIIAERLKKSISLACLRMVMRTTSS